MYSKQQLQQIWRLHLNKWPQEYQNRIWPTFGCKVGQKVLIAMKLELDLWCRLQDVGFLEKKRTYVEKYTEGYLRTKFERFILIYESMIAKNEFDLLLAVN